MLRKPVCFKRFYDYAAGLESWHFNYMPLNFHMIRGCGGGHLLVGLKGGDFAMRMLRAFLADEAGSNVVEYALVGSIVTIVAIGSMIAMGGQVDAYLRNIIDYLS